MTKIEDIISIRDAKDRVARIDNPDHALMVLAWAIRSDDFPVIDEILEKAKTAGWDDIVDGLPRFLEHMSWCVNERIELSHYPEYGKTTVRCQECGAHRAHDGSGRPVPTDEGATPTDTLMRPAGNKRPAKTR